MGKRVIGESFLAAIGNDTDKLLITLRYEFLLVKPWYMCKLIMEMVYTPGVEHWLLGPRDWLLGVTSYNSDYCPNILL